MPHKFARKTYRVTDWAEYNESLRQRGNLTIWIPDEALCQWSAPRRTTSGGQSRYSDMAIPICLTLGVVFKLPLRQTHGRLAWQISSGYNQRSRGETQIGRWTGGIGLKLKARSLENQKTKAMVSVRVFNKMTEVGRPEFEIVR